MHLVSPLHFCHARVEGRARDDPHSAYHRGGLRPPEEKVLAQILQPRRFSSPPGSAKLLQWCLTLCKPLDCSPPGSYVRGTLQARILEWVAIPTSRGSSQPRNRTCVSFVSCTGRQVFFTTSATREAPTLQAESKKLPSEGDKSTSPLSAHSLTRRSSESLSSQRPLVSGGSAPRGCPGSIRTLRPGRRQGIGGFVDCLYSTPANIPVEYSLSWGPGGGTIRTGGKTSPPTCTSWGK